MITDEQKPNLRKGKEDGVDSHLRECVVKLPREKPRKKVSRKTVGAVGVTVEDETEATLK